MRFSKISSYVPGWTALNSKMRCPFSTALLLAMQRNSSLRSPTRRWTRSGELDLARGRHRPGAQRLRTPARRPARQVVLPYPVMSDRRPITKSVHINDDGDLPGFATHVVDGRYLVAEGGAGPPRAAGRDPAEVTAAIGRRARDHRAVRPGFPGGRSAAAHHAAHSWEAGPPRTMPGTRRSRLSCSPARCTIT